MADQLALDLIKRAQTVWSKQAPWHQLWDDAARVYVPRLLGFSEEQVHGASRVDELFDGTPMRAARGLGNAIAAMLRPEGEKWVTVKAEDDDLEDDDEAREWLDDTNERFRNALDNPKARMRDVMGATDLSLVVFGTGAHFVGESHDLRHLQFQSIHLKDAGIDWDEEASAYAFYRNCRYSVRYAEQRFGFKNLGEKARELLVNKKVDDKLTYIHAVLPRKDRVIGGVFNKNLPFASYWIEQDSQAIVSEAGFHEFPFITPRMETAPNEDYGRSPGMVGLPDSNTLQAMGETILTAGQKAAEPPIMAPNDGSFSEANTFPGGITYYDVSVAKHVRGNPIFPLQTGSDLPITLEMQNSIRDQVFAAFFRNILNLPVGGPQMTATEIIQRKEEFLREVGPMFGRLETNHTAPTVERSFAIMLRAGGFRPIPLSLAGRNVKFEYESPVRRIREQIEAQAAALWAREVIEVAKVEPSAIDALNVDEYLKFQHDAAKIPERLRNTDDVIAAKRQQRAEQQQMVDRMAAAEKGVGIAKTGADAMKAAGLVDEAQPAAAA